MVEPIQRTRALIERELLAESGLFDESAYLSKAGYEAFKDPIAHYLQIGWRIGLDPNATFPGTLLLPYFATLGIDEAPAITWLLLRTAGWAVPSTWAEAEWLAARVRDTGLFDDAFYRRQFTRPADGLDSAIHYITVGERLGMHPCAQFDPRYYGRRNPDIIQAGMNCLLHYAQYGRSEGRAGSPSRVGRSGLRAIDPGKRNVIMVVHETSRSGAPILGWNVASWLARTHNVYTVHLGDGDLTPDFEALSVEIHGPFKGVHTHQIDLECSLHKLLDGSRQFSYAIVNSVESRGVIEPMVHSFIPTLLLVHEFAAYVFPRFSLLNAFDWSSEIVFPARVVASAAEDAHPVLRTRRTFILPQGMSLLPPGSAPAARQIQTGSPSNKVLEDLSQKHDSEGAFIVLGAGSVHLRKGVDLFLAAAATVIRSETARTVHFLWVGEGYRPETDMSFSVYLREQLNRSNLNAHITFLDAVSDLEPVYRIADVFFLPSRLDPLPNVSIDAASRGIPIVCFKDASGIADLLLSDPETADGVVDHLDADAAGRFIVRLARDEDLRTRMAEATRSLARKFDMEAYVARLDLLGTEAADRMKTRSEDAEILRSDPTFDQDMYLGPSQVIEPRSSTIVRYLALAAARGWDEPPVANTALRRPSPGFNPRIYAAANAFRLSAGGDPLADFVRQGKPPGPWCSKVLRPDDSADEIAPSGRLRVALHAHLFYPELAGDLLARIQTNSTRCDLFVSTENPLKAEQLRNALGQYAGGTVDIRVVPNRGRDIGPFLTEFPQALANYEVIGHLHAKRSVFSDTWQDGDIWREFLWQNLVGGMHPMLDRIVAAFERENGLGLVFPSDPHLIGWGENRARSTEIAGRMGWKGTLPDHFDFPLGTMFWARRQALTPLLGLGLGWNDYPDEPVPIDGTILHALERLTPFACHLAGFSFAVTHVFGVSW